MSSSPTATRRSKPRSRQPRPFSSPAAIRSWDPASNALRGLVIELAARYRLPAIFALRAAAVDGGLISYGADILDLFHRAAVYADRILKGEKPTNLPVQLPTKFELVINLKTAKALGFEVPTSLLATADEVIE